MKLSIITINWNNQEGLRMTMDNVLGQTARDQFEYIVVDGGAEDGSGEMLANEYDTKVDKWTSQPIKPIYRKMNMGVQMATGDYCLFLNSGDSLNDPDVIKDVLPHLDKAYDLIIGTIMEGKCRTRVPDDITYLWMYKASIPHSGAFIRRELLLKNPYDENLVIVSDWKFFLQLLLKERVQLNFIPDVVSVIDYNGISKTNKDLFATETQRLRNEVIPSYLIRDLDNSSSLRDLFGHKMGKKLYSVLYRLFTP